MQTGNCANCNLHIEFDETAPEKPRDYWSGLWRDTASGSVECHADDPYVVDVGWGENRQVLRLHDPIQRWLLTYHSVQGSMSEAVDVDTQWLVKSRKEAESLEREIIDALEDMGYDDYLFNRIPLGEEMIRPDAAGGWSHVVERFRKEKE